METTIALATPSTGIPVPPPRRRRGKPLQPQRLAVHALQLLSLLPLLPLAALAVQLTRGRPLPSGRGRRPTYADGSILVIAILARLWRLSYQEVLDWLRGWPPLAQACGLPSGRVPAKGTLSKRLRRLGNAPLAALFCLLVLAALRAGILWGRDVCLDSTLLAAWSRQDPDAAWSYPSHKRRVFGYKVHTLLDRASGLPLFFLVTPANRHDLPVAYWVLWLAKSMLALPLAIVRADAAYWGLAFIQFVVGLGAQPVIPFNRKRQHLSRVRWLVRRGLRWGARSVIERFFAVAKRYYGLDGHYAMGAYQVIRQVLLTYIAVLVVAMVAHQLQAPHLALSPKRVLTHFTPPEEGL